MENRTWLAEYRALMESAGIVDLAARTQLELRGPDRSTFLHNLCTNEIRKLPPGAGCEAFITTVQGKTLGYVYVFSGNDTLVLETTPGQGQKLREHLEKYLIREKVEIVDRSSDWAEWLIAGPQSETVLKKAMSHGKLPEQRLWSEPATLAQTPVWLRRLDLAGIPSFLIDCLRGDHARVGNLLHSAGAIRCGHDALDAFRMEVGYPRFGHDITENNLPQEVARDKDTICFTKGCYLGQETIARLDALGHVNRLLVGLRFLDSKMPAPGVEVLAGDQAVGRLTSVAWSPRLKAPLAFAYIRHGQTAPGTRFSTAVGPAEVVTLPLAAAG